ncbi:MAG: T9SS type A sorting domain-containing protein [Bacteroidetes bacterium]|nr:T9SS type A sorting domain-containing protein [Bacteroidota bacterium]
MKKIITFIFLTAIVKFTYAQIPNPSFENIKNVTDYKAAYWTSTGRIEKTADANGGSNAIKQYGDGGSNPFSGGVVLYVASSALDNTIPYEGKPTHLEFYMKGDFKPGDSLLVSSNLTANGDFYGVVNLDITTISNNFFKITAPITFIDSSILCDTVALTFFFKGSDSSYFILDDVKFTSNGVEEGQLVNGDFETWTADQFKVIEGWSTSNDIGRAFGFNFNAVKDTSDSYQGNKAVYMQNISFFGQAIPGAIITGNQNIDQAPAFPVTGRHQYLNGYYKYKPSGKDSFNVEVTMFYQGNEVGKGLYRSGATVNQYQKFICQINYDSVSSVIPDSANILVSAGPLDNPVAGSKAWVDQLWFENVGVEKLVPTVSSVAIYPNPASHSVYMNVHANPNEMILVQLYDLQGKLVKNIYQGKTLSNSIQIETGLESIANGIYIVSVQLGDKVSNQKLQVVHE